MSFQDGDLTGIRWMDKRPVAALLTINDSSMTTVTRRSQQVPSGIEIISKPVMIVEYNKFMGGVDIADVVISQRSGENVCSSTYLCTRLIFLLRDLDRVGPWKLPRCIKQG